jgi:DNA mismatch repair protein MutS2
VLIALPDRRDRAQVQVGAAKLTLPATQLQGAPVEAATRRSRVRVPEAHPDAIAPCDLRGEHVLEAEDKLEKALEQALAAQAYQLTVIHGFGTGALRRAVREHLQRSPYVERYESAQPSEGGEGSTVAYLRSG